MARLGTTRVRGRRKTLGSRSLALRFRKKSSEFGTICRLFAGSGIDDEEDGSGGVAFAAQLTSLKPGRVASGRRSHSTTGPYDRTPAWLVILIFSTVFPGRSVRSDVPAARAWHAFGSGDPKDYPP